MKAILPWLLLLYLVALHSSMAGMEFFSWTLMAAVIGERLWHRRSFFIKEDRDLLIILAGLILSVFMSLVMTPPEKGFVWQMGFMRWTVLLFVVRWALEDVWSKEFSDRLAKVWIFATTVTGLYAAFQCLTGIDLIRPTKHVIYPQGGGIYKAVGFFSFSLTFAYSMGLSVFGSGLTALRKNRWLGILCLVAGGLGLIASMSRGAWLAALAAAFFYLAMKNRKLILPFAIATVLLVVGLMFFSPAFSAKINTIILLKMDNSSMVRVHLWRAYWAMFLDHPLFGVGIFDGDLLLPQYYARLGIDEPFASHAHNNFLNWLAGTGIFGFAFYTALVAMFLRKTWRLREISEWGWPLLLAQVFFHLGGMTECNFIDGELTHFLVFMWAMVLCLETKAKTA